MTTTVNDSPAAAEVRASEPMAPDNRPWIRTFSGVKFRLIDPDPQLVRDVDIAHALARICRFTGHTTRHYSVAEHSVRVAHWVRERGRPDLYLATLLHDAHEAYVGDRSTPLKLACAQASQRLMARGVDDSYRYVATQVSCAIFTAFGVSEPQSEGWELIKAVDQSILIAEARELLCGESVNQWDSFPPLFGYPHNAGEFGWPIGIAELRFRAALRAR